jgi:hypothetical protein
MDQERRDYYGRLLLEKYGPNSDKITFFSIPISEYTKEELIAIIHMQLIKDNKDAQPNRNSCQKIR